MAGISSPKDTLLAKLIHTTTKLNYCLMQLTLIALLNINMRLCWKTKLIKPRANVEGFSQGEKSLIAHTS
ncbi:MAG TPA: hypothetical protein DCM23_02865 [Firmicutes bacterium]|nr:hypothetical protein [Bacillota bacterium]